MVPCPDVAVSNLPSVIVALPIGPVRRTGFHHPAGPIYNRRFL